MKKKHSLATQWPRGLWNTLMKKKILVINFEYSINKTEKNPPRFIFQSGQKHQEHQHLDYP